MESESDLLRNYAVAKQRVAGLVRAAKEHLSGRGDTASAEECQTLLVRLAEDRFNLAVVGQFKRGKSSLMNAIIGQDLLPTGLLPLTSAITTLCYGPKPRALLKRQGWSFEQEITLGELADYVTERGNPGNQKGLVEARVELPVPFLRRGLHFIDTPGVGSARQENTTTTLTFLPQADAVILVTSVEAPLTEIEESFLREIRNLVRKLFIVVNKMDLLAPGERDSVLEYIHEGVARVLATEDLRLFPLSARLGLQAKMGRLADDESGLTEFEATLAHFIGEEKERTFLVAVLDRVERWLEGAEGTRDLKSQLQTLRAALTVGALLPHEQVPANPKLIEQAVIAQRHAARRETPALYSSRCSICAAQLQALFDFFAHWQFTLAKDASAQQSFAAARGFCPVHTWQFERIASPQGISEGYALVVDAAAEALRSSATLPDQAFARVGELLPSVSTCAACRVLRESEEEQVRQLLLHLGALEAQRRYEQTAGLCLPHLRLALAAAPSAGLAEFLLRTQAQRFEELSEDMRNYTLKREALRRGLVNDQEEQAYRRALAQLVGEARTRVF